MICWFVGPGIVSRGEVKAIWESPHIRFEIYLCPREKPDVRAFAHHVLCVTHMPDSQCHISTRIYTQAGVCALVCARKPMYKGVPCVSLPLLSFTLLIVGACSEQRLLLATPRRHPHPQSLLRGGADGLYSWCVSWMVLDTWHARGYSGSVGEVRAIALPFG